MKNIKNLEPKDRTKSTIELLNLKDQIMENKKPPEKIIPVDNVLNNSVSYGTNLTVPTMIELVNSTNKDDILMKGFSNMNTIVNILNFISEYYSDIKNDNVRNQIFDFFTNRKILSMLKSNILANIECYNERIEDPSGQMIVGSSVSEKLFIILTDVMNKLNTDDNRYNINSSTENIIKDLLIILINNHKEEYKRYFKGFSNDSIIDIIKSVLNSDLYLSTDYSLYSVDKIVRVLINISIKCSNDNKEMIYYNIFKYMSVNFKLAISDLLIYVLHSDISKLKQEHMISYIYIANSVFLLFNDILYSCYTDTTDEAANINLNMIFPNIMRNASCVKSSIVCGHILKYLSDKDKNNDLDKKYPNIKKFIMDNSSVFTNDYFSL